MAYLCEKELDPREVEVEGDLMDALMTKMSATNPDWSGLPDVFDIWNKHAIKHACKTILNAKHDHCAPLLRKMEEYRKLTRKEILSLRRTKPLRSTRGLAQRNRRRSVRGHL